MNGQAALQAHGDLAQQRVFGLLSTLDADVSPLSVPSLLPESAPPSSRRSEAETMPYSDPFTNPSRSPFSSRGAHDWCVDLGPELRSMTTFELWQAIERAEVIGAMRVWREGMECWTPVGDLVEFSLALASARGGDPSGEVTPSPAPHALTPAPVDEVDRVTLDRVTLDRLPAPRASVAPPRSSRLSLARFAGDHLSGARWIGLGAAVALVAIVSALASSTSPAAPPPRQVRLASQGAAPIAPEVKPAPAEEEPRALPVDRADDRLDDHLDDRPAEAAPRHQERGQRRLSRGGRAR